MFLFNVHMNTAPQEGHQEQTKSQGEERQEMGGSYGGLGSGWTRKARKTRGELEKTEGWAISCGSGSHRGERWKRWRAKGMCDIGASRKDVGHRYGFLDRERGCPW